MMRVLWVVVLMVVAGAASAQGRTLLKCVLPDGSVAFQQHDCDKNAEVTRIAVPDPDPEPPAEQTVGKEFVAQVAQAYPEILESQQATNIVIARRDQLIAQGETPQNALLTAASEYSASIRRSAYRSEQAQPQRQPNYVAESQQDPMYATSDMVLCTEPSGKTYMRQGSCPPSVTRYRSEMVDGFNPNTGQSSRVLANVPYQKPIQQRSMTKREACVQGGIERGTSTYDKAKHRALNGSPEGPCK